MKKLIELTVNGEVYEVEVSTHRTLLEALREDNIGLTGSKEACGQGACGACTVIMDGRPILSCLTLAIEAQGKDIVTIEGLAHEGKLDPVQQAFVDHGAVQCGFCTPGLVLTAKALLDKNPSPNEQEIKEAISGNLCRCTGYVQIVEAIKVAAEKGA